MPCHTPLEIVPSSVISNALISAFVWSAVADASILSNLDFKVFVKSFAV